MPWKKDGVAYTPPLILDDIAWWHPTRIMMIEAGYVWEDPPITVADYDNAMENHLLQERCARGYTTREPDYYLTSSVPRWAQDAKDWVAHRDTVMLYGLDVINKYEAGEPVPTLEEFREKLPRIIWTIELSAAE